MEPFWVRNPLTELFGTQLPLVQAGMVWCSGWRLASAVANAGGLGLLGAGSMHPEVLRNHLAKCQETTSYPIGVNLPLLYPDIEAHLEAIFTLGVRTVFTSAGNPAQLTPRLKDRGITVVHVVSSVRFAEKAQAAGCDAVVAEGFEAGGHNGREETTTLVLVPAVAAAVDIPVLAAGGIATGAQWLAAEALGAAGVQVGTRFAVTDESSAHPAFKQQVLAAVEGDTRLQLKSLTPVRMLRNPFSNQVAEAESRGADAAELSRLLGRGRAKRGIFEGDLKEGELEIGQVSALIRDCPPASVVVARLVEEYRTARTRLCGYEAP